MAGTLGKLNLMPPEELEVGAKKLDVYDAAMDALNRRGLQFAGKPRNGYTGEMPNELTSLDDEQLGDLLNKCSAWCGFAEAELAKISAQRESSSTVLDFIRARVRMALRTDPDGKKMTVQDKNDAVETDPRVVEARATWQFHDHLYDLGKVFRDKAQRDWETVSRHITLRGQEVDRMRRDSNVAGVPTQARQFHRRPVVP